MEMNNGLINKKTLLLSAALLGVLGLSGCGNTSDEEKTLAVFSSSIADFKDYIQEADERINGLDVNQQESASELLEILDSMETEFAEFAELSRAQAPNQYESISRLAEQASSDMTMAVSFFFSVYWFISLPVVWKIRMEEASCWFSRQSNVSFSRCRGGANRSGRSVKVSSSRGICGTAYGAIFSNLTSGPEQLPTSKLANRTDKMFLLVIFL